MKKIYLHIGTLKTGSTSLQRYLLDHADCLSKQGFALYRGEFQEANHTELHLAAMRYERDSFAKRGICKHLAIDADFTRRVADRIHAFLDACAEPRIIFTSEALCWLRHDDEIERLRTILDIGSNESTVVLYLRDKADFLRSYTDQIYKVTGRKPVRDFWSPLYVEPDTWLTDYDALISAYQKGFGAKNVVVIDYDEQLRTVGNVIPSFLRTLGLEAMAEGDSTTYFLNTTNPANERKPSHGMKGWIELAKRAWSRRDRRQSA